jgi:hypothetical protein
MHHAENKAHGPRQSRSADPDGIHFEEIATNDPVSNGQDKHHEHEHRTAQTAHPVALQSASLSDT